MMKKTEMRVDDAPGSGTLGPEATPAAAGGADSTARSNSTTGGKGSTTGGRGGTMEDPPLILDIRNDYEYARGHFQV